jgi:hypothetical protein
MVHAGLESKMRDGIVKDVWKRTTPGNVFSLLFAANWALTRLGSVVDPWAEGELEKGWMNVYAGESRSVFGREREEGRSGRILCEAEVLVWRFQRVMEALKRGPSRPESWRRLPSESVRPFSSMGSDKHLADDPLSAILLSPMPRRDATVLANTSSVRAEVE